MSKKADAIAKERVGEHKGLVESFWTKQEEIVDAMCVDVVAASAKHLMGGPSEGVAWTKDLKSNPKKKWATLLAYAEKNLLCNVDVEAIGGQLDMM